MADNKDKIKALDTRQQCRDKLPTWFGSRENYLHGLREIIGNAVDEIDNNFDSGEIVVLLHEDNQTITVSDTGRGIPIDGDTDGIPNEVLLFETLFAGTNYDNNENGKITVGTNGVGTTVLNHTSLLFDVISYRNGKKYRVKYKNGALEKQVYPIEDCSSEIHGTQITFKLDPEVYTDTIYKAADLKLIINKIASTANSIAFFFKQKGTDEVERFKYNSFEEYFEKTVENLTSNPLIAKPVIFDIEGEKNEVSFILASATETTHESFLNRNWLPEHGTIHDGLIAGVRTFMNKRAKELKLLDKKATAFTTSDIEDSISYTAAVLSTNVEYANQTKLSTNKKLYRSIMSQYVQSVLEAFEVEQPKEFKKIIDHIVQVNKFNNKNTAAKNALKKQLNEKVDSINNRIDKLVECEETGPEAEIYIAEGDSALGSVVLARDSLFQAAYPLRGKILNCMKASLMEVLENKIIIDMVRAFGTGIVSDKKHKELDSFDMSKSNYGKFIIATDADPDGQQIACLLITFFYRLLRPLLEAGKVYIALTPLYEVKLEDDSMVYIFNEGEKEEKLSKIEGKYTISRCKGLGEVDAETLAFTAMDPETRQLLQITVEDAEKMIASVEDFMGESIDNRRQYMEENLANYVMGEN